ncbi:hypothetical protein [Undibacterium oligocarboniphilum]|uniref:Uncharacterized protein n=1 Tax=Undibacterium oligocarboniphilum TaxID=666702 RepID=A0A850QIF7_9BURK|nr:hypothetical protein [Undibacterium oligocarboniphilum]MBC3871725.1 hypothetical protein [Undibacterium oligocarboniphilum]NVO79361.1 hypothetical protein [Undibacterium oligocarboniphilum]
MYFILMIMLYAAIGGLACFVGIRKKSRRLNEPLPPKEKMILRIIGCAFFSAIVSTLVIQVAASIYIDNTIIKAIKENRELTADENQAVYKLSLLRYGPTWNVKNHIFARRD